MKASKKIIMFLIFIVIICFINSTLAATIGTGNITSNKDLGEADTQLESIGSRIFTAVSNVGIVASVVVIAIIGVKYMLGSVDEKADYKNSMIPYLIGAFLVFGASAIAKAVYTIAKM